MIDRYLLCVPISIAPAPKKSWRGPGDRALARRTGTKIHTLVDALGNPLGFFLTGGEAHDLVGADRLLPTMEADMLIADKAFDADTRVLVGYGITKTGATTCGHDFATQAGWLTPRSVADGTN